MHLKHIITLLLAGTLSATATLSEMTPADRLNEPKWKARYEQQVERMKTTPCDVLFLGDSITDQWDTGAGRQLWASRFKDFHPLNFGISGDQTKNLLWRIQDSGLPSITAPKLCIIMIGTNNTGHFQTKQSPETAALATQEIAARLLVRYPQTHVLILGIFPRGNSPTDARRLHNDKINALLADCRLPRTSFANINHVFLNDQGEFLPGLTHDFLHLTEKGFTLWADALMPYLQQYCTPAAQ